MFVKAVRIFMHYFVNRAWENTTNVNKTEYNIYTFMELCPHDFVMVVIWANKTYEKRFYTFMGKPVLWLL